MAAVFNSARSVSITWTSSPFCLLIFCWCRAPQSITWNRWKSPNCSGDGVRGVSGSKASTDAAELHRHDRQLAITQAAERRWTPLRCRRNPTLSVRMSCLRNSAAT